MTDHILNRPAPPRPPDPVVHKPTPEQIAILERKRLQKAAEDVARAISRSR